jgi:TRAP-type C4-dicarboxylate transport system permease small subunit
VIRLRDFIFGSVSSGGTHLFFRFRNFYKKLLEYIVIFLMIVLTLVVVVAVIYRKMDASLSWYDEVASVLLAWLTYYGAALAAINRDHIGFNGLVNALRPSFRIPLIIIGEVFVIGFFMLLAWVGISVLQILGGDALTSLTWVPTRLTQSVIPIGAVLFIIAETMSLPGLWRMAKSTNGITAQYAVEIPNESNNNLDSSGEELSK